MRGEASSRRVAFTLALVVTSTWESRDLPVLQALVELSDEGHSLRSVLSDLERTLRARRELRAHRERRMRRGMVPPEEAEEAPPRLSQIENRLGIDGSEVMIALRALMAEEPPFFTYHLHYSTDRASIGTIVGVTGHARRTVGSWPTPEALANRLVEGLEKAADQETDEERKSWLRKTADWLGGAGREIAVEVTAEVVKRQIGG